MSLKVNKHPTVILCAAPTPVIVQVPALLTI